MAYHVSKKEHIFIADLIKNGQLNHSTLGQYIKEHFEDLSKKEKSLQSTIEDLHYQIDLIQRHNTNAGSESLSPRNTIKTTSPRLVSNTSPRNSIIQERSSENLALATLNTNEGYITQKEQDQIVQLKVDDIQQQLKSKMVEYDKTVTPLRLERELLLKIKQIIDELSDEFTKAPSSPRLLSDNDRWEVVSALMQMKELNKSGNPLRLSGNLGNRSVSSPELSHKPKLADSPSMERLRNLIKGLSPK